MEKLRGLISDGGMSRSGLARAAGLHANSLRRMDEPDWNPTADTLGKLETYLLKREGGTALASPEEIINEARNGRMFILVDDEDRENEGDLVIPAQMATPEAINFMRSDEHTSELQYLMRISYAVFCLTKNTYNTKKNTTT